MIGMCFRFRLVDVVRSTQVRLRLVVSVSTKVPNLELWPDLGDACHLDFSV